MARFALAAVVAVASLALLLAAPASAAVGSPDGLWTWLLPQPHGYPTSSVSAAAPGSLFVATTQPDVLVTHDGGATWSWSRTSSVAGYARTDGVSFISAQEGWAWGGDSSYQHGMLLHTADGGLTWQLQLDLPGWSFCDVCCANTPSGWAVARNSGDEVRVYVTQDGGATWQQAPAPHDGYTTFTALASVAPGQAMLMEKVWSWGPGMGEEIGTLMTSTTDYGATWTTPSTFRGANLRDAAFTSPDKGWAIDGTCVWVTTDGGVVWKKVYQGPVGGGLVRIATLGDDIWVAGTVSLHSSDGGATWSALPGVRGARVSICTAQDVWIAYAAQYHHTTDDGQSWSAVGPASYPDVTKLKAVSAQTVWAAGGGSVLKSTDAGKHWKSLTKPRGLTAMAAASTVQAWASGPRGLILHTTDSGRHWAAQKSSVQAKLLDIFFRDTKHGWAAGAKGTLLRTTDGGRHWLKAVSPRKTDIQRVVFADAAHGLALTAPASGKAAVLRSVNGGRTWSVSKLPAGACLPTAMTLSGKEALVMSGMHPSHVWRSRDYGKTWRQAAELDTGLFHDLALSGARVCAVGSGGAVATSTDDGKTWSLSNPAGGELTCVQFAGSDALMIGGELGILLRDLTTSPLP